MDKIEAGEYVRTERGVIYKYTEEEKEDIMLQDFRLCNDGKIVKHSFNIIDLIEVGDYVNGKEILEIKQNAENGLRYLKYNFIPLQYYKERTDDIKTIITKEQIETVKYKAGE